MTSNNKSLKIKKSKIKQFFSQFIPGIITGISDDDPSGIATYSQAGAQFGLAQLWTAFYQIPLLIAVQEACARIGAAKNKGLAAVIKDHYSKKILYLMVGLVVIANTINIGADIGAVATSVQLIVDVPFWLIAIIATMIIIILEVFYPYKVYAKILMFFGLCIVAYPITTFMVKQPWGEIFKASFLPQIKFTPQYLFITIGVMGTSITPYMFFWQASEEVEEERELKHNKNGKPIVAKSFFQSIKRGTETGMLVSQLGQWFIMITAATILHKNGITNINSAADAAKALEPLVANFPNAGHLAKIIFATGIIGLGFMGIPILAGSAAYAVAETFDWQEGLNQKITQARGFYTVIIISCLIGMSLNFIGINPMKALVYTAVINGFAAVPLLYIIGLINGSKKIMGKHCGNLLSQILVWLSAIVMTIAAIGLVLGL